MNTVYTLTSVWKNGEKFEGEITTKVYADESLAKQVLALKAQEARDFLLKRYDEEDINTKMGINHIIVDANEYADYWEGWVEGQTIIG